MNPETPANTGRQESIVFNADASWKRWVNQQFVDSGTYSLGNGIYQAYAGATQIPYDSIGYIGNAHSCDCYKISQNTLTLYGRPGVMGGGSKWWVREY